ncbi:methanol dehydrogenase (cytochrome c) subunit 1 [Novimethylophilus kurashikiensis]|uniref:Methanol dehydrogenase (Cytochrome c) subunit 1 n=1 Tax=Novimethylophilus kurashikiensis TaxID=1825523 RepID=A0A2R5FBF8_9PROT|nr:hypothetical protein [Novimethylophilus kurashikiensis]GBG15149.1 methanol dehydrogenase (cytochrome c) subunit 1 [Novimethylophilus kurashikiensis]
MDMPSPANLFGMLVFGIVGLAAFRYGKKRHSGLPMIIGTLLMVYPYFVSTTVLMYLVGLALCAGLYFLRDRF